MKRTLSAVLLGLSSLILIASIVFCLFSFSEIHRISDELANNPSASGIDYMGLGWGYGICLFVASAFGFILSGISKKLLQQKKLRYISITAMVIFALLLITSIFLFYM